MVKAWRSAPTQQRQAPDLLPHRTGWVAAVPSILEPREPRVLWVQWASAAMTHWNVPGPPFRSGQGRVAMLAEGQSKAHRALV
jgi:hypothetical protein